MSKPLQQLQLQRQQPEHKDQLSKQSAKQNQKQQQSTILSKVLSLYLFLSVSFVWYLNITVVEREEKNWLKTGKKRRESNVTFGKPIHIETPQLEQHEQLVRPQITMKPSDDEDYKDERSMHDEFKVNSKSIENDGDYSKTDHDAIHIVFSTGCSSQQDWQSYLLFFSIWQSGQSGHVTRIASGCLNEGVQKEVETAFREQVLKEIPNASQRFHIHFTPDYSRVHFDSDHPKHASPYKFFNKPYGLKHWMEHGLGFHRIVSTGTKTNGKTQSAVRIPQRWSSTIFIVLDPDQIILKPFVFHNDHHIDPYDQLYQPNQPHQPHQPQTSSNVQNKKVSLGYPHGQLYLFGGQWIHPIQKNITRRTAIMDAAHVELTTPTSEFATTTDDYWLSEYVHWDTYRTSRNGLYSWNSSYVDHTLAAGPPYIAVGLDIYNIVTVWKAVVVQLYSINKAHLAEMYAYSTAAAYLNLPHTLHTSYMVSHTGVTLEGWDEIDKSSDPTLSTNRNERNPVETSETNFLTLSDPTRHPIKTRNDTNLEQDQHLRQRYPNILHYCQRYYLGPYFFSKYKVPSNIMSCKAPLLLEPPSTVELVTSEAEDRHDNSATSTATIAMDGRRVRLHANTLRQLSNAINNTTQGLSPNSNSCGQIAYIYNSATTPDNTFYNNIDVKEAKRHTFILCHLLYQFNAALSFWKNNHCKNHSVSNKNDITDVEPLTNYEKIFVFSDHSYIKIQTKT